MGNQIQVTKSARETFELGEKFADSLKNGGVVCLYGDLGSGKTTFVQGVARGLGIKQRIISPTFVVIKEYKRPRHAELISASDGFSKIGMTGEILNQVQDDTKKIGNLYHIDLYRIDSLNDAKGLGLEEILSDPHNIVLIEWPEKIKDILPDKRIEIYFKYLKESEREIEWKIKIY